MSEHCPFSGRNHPGSDPSVLHHIMPVLMLVMLTFTLVVVPAAAAGIATVNGISPETGLNTTTVSITDLTGTGFLPVQR